MDTLYHITVNIQTPSGMLEIGKFFLGEDSVFSQATFDDLEGNTDYVKYPAIRLDLISITAGALPVCLNSIGCDLEQYGNNCRTLTREVFRHFMFEG